MADVPCEDLIGTRLDGASRDQRVVDRPTGNPVGGSFADTGEIFLALKTHKAEAIVDASGNSIAWSGVVRCGNGSRVSVE